MKTLEEILPAEHHSLVAEHGIRDYRINGPISLVSQASIRVHVVYGTQTVAQTSRIYLIDLEVK